MSCRSFKVWCTKNYNLVLSPEGNCSLRTAEKSLEKPFIDNSKYNKIAFVKIKTIFASQFIVSNPTIKYMSSNSVTTFFDKKASEAYDERNSRLSPVSKNLHFLIRLVLDDLPAGSEILCVGVGTGEELIALSEVFPGWHFTGVEPSEPMLEVCRKKINDRGLTERCNLVHGYLAEFNEDKRFDAVLCLLVTHFVTDLRERQAMYTDMYSRLKPGGYLVNADISDDMESPEFKSMLEKWKALHRFSGASEQTLEYIEKAMGTQLSVLSKSKLEELLVKAGFSLPVQFFQSLLIRAWYSKKG